MTTGDDLRSGSGNHETQRPPRLSLCFAMVAGFCLASVAMTFVLRHVDLSDISSSWLFQAVAAVVAAVVGAVVWEIRRWLMRTLTSLPFSIALLAFLLVLTAIGTVVLQQAPPEAYVKRHGQVLGSLLLSLGMDDLFHTLWFTALLALLGCILVLTAIEKRVWRPSMWGHMLSHLGFVVIMVGGWIGHQYGFKGVIDMHEGEVVHDARLIEKGGVPGERRPLGFALKLDKFAVEDYAPEAKFYVFKRDGNDFRAIRAFDLKEASVKRAIGSSGASFQLKASYPDFYLKPEVRALPPGQGGPVLQIDFKQGDWTSRAVLTAGAAGRDSTPLSANGPSLRFVWTTPSNAEVEHFAEKIPERHFISYKKSGDAGNAEEIAVAVGTTGILPGGGSEVTVLEYLPDFTFDAQSKGATSRSQDPHNPALHVRIKDQQTREEKTFWLFAKNPDFGHNPGDAAASAFVYRYAPARLPAEREWLALGEAQQLWRLEKGQVVQRLPWDQWQTVCTGLPVVGMQMYASAVSEKIPATRSAAWNNPVADIVVEENGATRDVRLTAEHAQPLALADGVTFLAFELRANEPKSFRSHLTVFEEGKKITEKTIVVNDPLSYKGCMFYQSNFRRDDPTYSGIQVVNDPGLSVVFVGFVMMAIGVIFIYYIRPRLRAGDSHGH